MINDKLYFEVVAKKTVTVLPRILQVLSRRSFLLEELSTEALPDGMVRLSCAASGPVRWFESLPGFLEKLVDVKSVTVKTEELDG